MKKLSMQINRVIKKCSKNSVSKSNRRYSRKYYDSVVYSTRIQFENNISKSYENKFQNSDMSGPTNRYILLIFNYTLLLRNNSVIFCATFCLISIVIVKVIYPYSNS